MADQFETVEMEVSEDDILYYLESENGEEIGFVIMEDGREVECYYEGFEEYYDSDEFEIVDAAEAVEDEGSANTANASKAAAKEPAKPAKAEDHGYLHKIASIAGFEGDKARKKAGAQLNKARDKAAPVVDRARSKAEEGVDKATAAVESGGAKIKQKQDEYDLGITREGIAETTADLNALAKEGAETAKELKEAYDDIMDSFGFLMPKGVRRRLP